MINRLFKRAAAAVAAAAMVMALSIPAFAATAYTPVAGTSTKFEKYIVMDSEAEVPPATFSFTVAPGAAKNYDVNGGKFSVYAGVGTPTATTAVFAPGDTTYSSIQKSAIRDNAGGEVDDQLTLAAGKKYARKEVTVSFTGCRFSEPGIYRYVVSESASSILGITNDAAATRILDVYVIDNGGSLEIQGYVLHASADDVPMGSGFGSDDTPAGKGKGYTNDYDTHDLTVKNTVTGNQGSKDKYFKYDLVISDAVPGTVYHVDLSGADSVSGSTEATKDAYRGQSNPATVTVGSDGRGTASFYLQSGQEVIIQGLADGTKYSVTEDPEDYKPSTAVTGDTDATKTDRVIRDEVTGITADTTDSFTNTRDGVIATGIALSAFPGIAVIAAAAGAFVMTRRAGRKED